MFLAIIFVCIASASAQHSLGHHFSKHGGHELLDSAHGSYGHGHHGSVGELGDQGYAKHGHHEAAGHKSYGSQVAKHDSNQKHHDKGYYERNKGHGYEKAYSYDKIKVHHDKGSSHGSHGYQHGQHSNEGSHKLADDSAHGYAKHAKKSQHGGHGYSNHAKLLGDHGSYHHSYDNRGHQAVPVVVNHGYDVSHSIPVPHSAPVYSGPEHFGYLHRK